MNYAMTVNGKTETETGDIIVQLTAKEVRAIYVALSMGARSKGLSLESLELMPGGFPVKISRRQLLALLIEFSHIPIF